MADEQMTRCETCNLVFNKVTYPECPRCRHTRRKEADAADVAAGVSAGAGRPAGAEVDLAESELAHKLVQFLKFVATFLAGGVLFVVAINRLAGLPWNTAPLYVVKVPEPILVWRTPHAPPEPERTAADVLLEAAKSPLVIDDWSRNAAGNQVTFEGTVRNQSSTELREARIDVLGHNAKGAPISSGWALVAPPEVPPGETARFRVTLQRKPGVDQYVVKGSWNQSVEKQLRVVSSGPGL